MVQATPQKKTKALGTATPATTMVKKNSSSKQRKEGGTREKGIEREEDSDRTTTMEVVFLFLFVVAFARGHVVQKNTHTVLAKGK